MDIALVVHHYNRAEGTGGYVVELATRLAREHQVTIYAAGMHSDPPDGARVVKVPALRGRAYATILSFPTAFATVRGRHDVVHVQGWSANQADVVTAHIVLGAWREAAARSGGPAPMGERLLGAWVQRRERRLMTGARRVIAPSRRAAADIARCYGRSESVTIVPHGFPASTELPDRGDARTQLRIPPGAFVALYAGDARKGAEAAIRAVAAAPGVHLLVASHSRRDWYLARARELGVADRVSWPGAVADVRQAFAAADVLFHPTIYDTFALVVAEAMAWGVPVVVSHEAGIVDLIEHERTGWILTGDGSDAAAVLIRLRNDEPLRSRLAATARLTAQARSWDLVTQETVAVYDAARHG